MSDDMEEMLAKLTETTNPDLAKAMRIISKMKAEKERLQAQLKEEAKLHNELNAQVFAIRLLVKSIKRDSDAALTLLEEALNHE